MGIDTIIIVIYTMLLFHLNLVHGICQESCGCNGWVPYGDEKCYRVFNTTHPMTYEQSGEFCGALKPGPYYLTLPIVESADEQRFLDDYLSDTFANETDVWIGARRKASAHNVTDFKWWDGTTLVYNNWLPGQPSPVDRLDCIAMISVNSSYGKSVDHAFEQGLWANTLCDAHNVVLCQKVQYLPYRELQLQVMADRRRTTRAISDLDTLRNIIEPTPNCCVGNNNTNNINNINNTNNINNINNINNTNNTNNVNNVNNTINSMFITTITNNNNDDNKNNTNSNQDLSKNNIPNFESVCGDGWDVFHNNNYDICYKHFPDGFGNFHSNVKTCGENLGSTLPTINSQAEQDFLNKMIIKYQMVDNIWLDAGVKDKHIVWTDRSSGDYENWMSGRPVDDTNCVEMLTEHANRGKWHDQSCAKKNGYLCKRVVKRTDARVEQLLANKHVLDFVIAQIAQLKKDQDERDAKFTMLEQNLMPLGLIYIQLPNQANPETLWPQYTWSDVTTEYWGQFFRAEGGGSLPFEQGVQSEDAPRISSVERRDGNVITIDSTPYTININPEQWSDWIYTGSNNGQINTYMYHRFFMNNKELHPINQAVRIFKRTRYFISHSTYPGSP